MIQLSICLPTRNRQKYCMETIRAIATSGSADFEVIVGDNSDDTSVLANFFATDFSDPRFRLIGPEDRVLSMVDNWLRLATEAKGRWIAFIGDDDYIDPRLVRLLKYYEKMYPEVESVSWNRMSFNWPDNRPHPSVSVIPVTHGTHIIPRQRCEDELFLWNAGKRKPSAGFGAYHGALRRSLMERIKRKYGNRYFEHPNVDFDSSCKTIREARMLVHCNRPFSVLGACAASNSAGTRSQKVLMKRNEIFRKEAKGTIELDQPYFPFPFTGKGSSHCSIIAATTVWFCQTYNIDLTGFPENFARAAVDECNSTLREDEFNDKVEYFQKGFDLWENGKWNKIFKAPQFISNKIRNTIYGIVGDYLHIREGSVPAQTPAEFYQFAENLIMPIEHVASGTRTFSR